MSCGITDSELIIGLVISLLTLLYCVPKLIYYVLLESYRPVVIKSTYWLTRWSLFLCLCFLTYIFLYFIGTREGMMAINVVAGNYISSLSSTLMAMLVYYGLNDKIEAGKFNEQLLHEKGLSIRSFYNLNYRGTIAKLILNPLCVSIFFITEKNWPALVYILLNLGLVAHLTHVAIVFIGVFIAQTTNVIESLKQQQAGQASFQQGQGYQAATNVHTEGAASDEVDITNNSIPIATRIAFVEKQLGGLKKVRTMIRVFLIITLVSNLTSIGSYWNDWNGCFYDSNDWSYSINGCLYAFTIVSFSQFVFATPKPIGVTARQAFCCEGGNLQTSQNQYSSMH